MSFFAREVNFHEGKKGTYNKTFRQVPQVKAPSPSRANKELDNKTVIVILTKNVAVEIKIVEKLVRHPKSSRGSYDARQGVELEDFPELIRGRQKKESGRVWNARRRLAPGIGPSEGKRAIS